MVAFVADYFIYKSEIKELYEYSPSLAETQAKISYFDFYRSGYWVQSIQKYKHYVKGEELERFRPIFNEKSLQAPILIFGCSFVYGSSLSENQTLSYKLAKETQRPIHTWGQEATGPAHMLFLLQNNIVFEKLKNSNDPEYAIWLYIPSHISRLFVNIFPHPLIINGINLKYEIKNDELKIVKNKLPDFFL